MGANLILATRDKGMRSVPCECETRVRESAVSVGVSFSNDSGLHPPPLTLSVSRK